MGITGTEVQNASFSVHQQSNRTLIKNDTAILLLASASNSARKKSFTCPICGKTFEDQLTLDAHKKMDHGAWLVFLCVHLRQSK